MVAEHHLKFPSSESMRHNSTYIVIYTALREDHVACIDFSVLWFFVNPTSPI